MATGRSSQVACPLPSQRVCSGLARVLWRTGLGGLVFPNSSAMPSFRCFTLFELLTCLRTSEPIALHLCLRILSDIRNRMYDCCHQILNIRYASKPRSTGSLRSGSDRTNVATEGTGLTSRVDSLCEVVRRSDHTELERRESSKYRCLVYQRCAHVHYMAPGR